LPFLPNPFAVAFSTGGRDGDQRDHPTGSDVVRKELSSNGIAEVSCNLDLLTSNGRQLELYSYMLTVDTLLLLICYIEDSVKDESISFDLPHIPDCSRIA
jgi:hypothetical protein